MSAAWEPPGGPTRVVGGLLAVAGGEAFVAGFDRHAVSCPLPAGAGSGAPGMPGMLGLSGAAGAPGGPGVTADRSRLLGHRCCEPDGPTTTALVDLGHSYVARRGRGVPVDVAERHAGVAGPAWLLPVAVVRSCSRHLVADTLELASASGAPRRALGDYVAYVQLAAGLLAGRPPLEVVELVTGGWLAAGDRSPGPLGAPGTPGSLASLASPDGAPLELSAAPCLSGDPAVDALAAGVWAVLQPGGIAQVMPRLAEITTPSVGAAAAGLLGLRDGRDAVPAHWQRRLRSAASCLALAPGLVRARCRDHLGQVVPSSRQAALAGAGTR